MHTLHSKSGPNEAGSGTMTRPSRLREEFADGSFPERTWNRQTGVGRGPMARGVQTGALLCRPTP
jgi:hypothetical protein